MDVRVIEPCCDPVLVEPLDHNEADELAAAFRVLADPVLHVDIPAARVEQVTLNGQPAVHILPILLDGLYALSSERVDIVEDFGITNISFEGRGDILDIARQVVGGGR